MLELQEYEREGIKKKYANNNCNDNKAILVCAQIEAGILFL